jgi:hypothetical protein
MKAKSPVVAGDFVYGLDLTPAYGALCSLF